MEIAIGVMLFLVLGVFCNFFLFSYISQKYSCWMIKRILKKVYKRNPDDEKIKEAIEAMNEYSKEIKFWGESD